ncbi:MAG: DUF3307 domain-containing protein [Elusimicrobia bacterium]|nr:DUF3307 domain-containing protein [Elusimicrobiota bacterium]
MLLLWRLLFGHFLADFTFQPDYINAWKRSTLLGMLVHCFIHPIVYALLVYPFLGETWLENEWGGFTGWQCVFFIFLLHLAEDWLRALAIRRYRQLDNAWCFLWDQIVHFAAIFLFVPVGALANGENGVIPEAWPVIGVLLVLVTHGGAIMIYYLEKDLFGSGFPSLWEKRLGMGERLVLCLLCMLPGGGWIVLAAGWLWLMYHARARRIFESSRFSLAAGACMALACGVAGRALLSG